MLGPRRLIPPEVEGAAGHGLPGGRWRRLGAALGGQSPERWVLLLDPGVHWTQPRALDPLWRASESSAAACAGESVRSTLAQPDAGGWLEGHCLPRRSELRYLRPPWLARARSWTDALASLSDDAAEDSALAAAWAALVAVELPEVVWLQDGADLAAAGLGRSRGRPG